MKHGKISDFCTVIAGQSPKGSSYNDCGNGLEFHQGKKAFGDSILEFSNVWTTEITKVAEPGDILMSVRAPVGPTNITNRKVCIGRGLAAIRCKDSVSPQFILYALRNIENKITGNDGAVFNSINKKMIEELPVPDIDNNQQKDIVEYLDSSFAKIDKLKENAAKNLEEAKALFQSAIKDALEPKEGWEEKAFDEFVVSNVVGLTRGKVEQGYDKKYPYFKMNNISNKNTLCWDDLISVDANIEEVAKFTLQEGDFLFNTRNSKEWVGKSTVYRNAPHPIMLYNNNIMRIRLKPIVNPVFMCYSFSADFTKNQLEKIKKGTTNVWAIYYRELAKIRIKYPSLSEQQSIVSFLDSLNEKVNTLQQNYSRICNECDALKQAILRQVFE